MVLTSYVLLEPYESENVESNQPHRLQEICKVGGDLLSHTVSHAVPLALKALTSVFGMRTGVSPSL